MSRYTVTTLRDDISKVNGWLESDGSTLRLTCGGRNGYQAIDEFSVDSDGMRIGSGVNRNVCCGTSRECGLAAFEFYGNENRRIKNDS